MSFANSSSVRLDSGAEEEPADVARTSSVDEFTVRVEPLVRELVLATVGVSTSTDGVGVFARDLIENSRRDSRWDSHDSRWDSRRD